MYGASAYLFWGLVPLYFKAVANVPPLEVLAHRVLWSVVLLGLLVSWTGQWRIAARALAEPKILGRLLGSTALVAGNWFVFIYAISNNEVLQASLGYFINPLVNVLLGFVFLRERLRTLQWISLALAATGVLYLTWQYGRIPWIAVSLAGLFGFYGLLRKTAAVESLVGLTLETALMSPLAFAYVVLLGRAGEGAFLAGSLKLDLLLPFAGVVTAVPLLWFAAAARRLRLATMGFLQYLAPSLQFVLAVWLFGEPFTRVHLFSFACIWTGLAMYSVDSAREARPGVVPFKGRPGA